MLIVSKTKTVFPVSLDTQKHFYIFGFCCVYLSFRTEKLMTKRENTVFSRIFAHLKIWCLRFSQLLYPFSIFRKSKKSKTHFFVFWLFTCHKKLIFSCFFFKKTEIEKGYPFATFWSIWQGGCFFLSIWGRENILQFRKP